MPKKHYITEINYLKLVKHNLVRTYERKLSNVKNGSFKSLNLSDLHTVGLEIIMY